MNNLNSIIIEGNLTRDANVTDSNGLSVANMVLAVNRYYKNRNGENVEEVSYFDIVAFGNTAEVCKKQAIKGRGLRVVGRLKQERWTDEDGKNHSAIKVIAEHIEFKMLKSKENEENAETND